MLRLFSLPRLVTAASLSLLAACAPTRHDEPHPQETTSAASPTPPSTSERMVTPGYLPPREGSAEIARKLEEKFQRGELEGMYRPVGYELLTFTPDGKTTVDPLPEAIHKHHEQLNDAWAAPDGTLFAAGFMYTGVPGPDTGVVYQKDGDAPVRIVYTKAENELGAVWGRGARDVYAVGNKLLVHWDGTSWSEIPLAGVEGAVRSVWGTAADLWIVTGKADAGFIYRRQAGGWKKEATAPCYLNTIHGAGGSVWAGGSCGAILRRDAHGAWSVERRTGPTQIMHLWARSDHEIYASTVGILYSDGRGAWSPRAEPSGNVFRVTGGAAGEVLALGTDGIFRSSGTGWTKMGVDASACTAVVARGSAITCLHEKREPYRGR